MKKILLILILLGTFLFAMGEPIYTDEEMGVLYQVSVHSIKKEQKTLTVVFATMPMEYTYKYENIRKLTRKEKSLLKYIGKGFNAYIVSDEENRNIYTKNGVYTEVEIVDSPFSEEY